MPGMMGNKFWRVRPFKGISSTNSRLITVLTEASEVFTFRPLPSTVIVSDAAPSSRWKFRVAVSFTSRVTSVSSIN